MKFKAEIYSDAPLLGKKTEVCNVSFDLNRLVLNIDVFESDVDLIVEFDEIIGFRALDECELLECWENYNLSQGWIFEVNSGGWFDLESTRKGFTCQGCDFYKEFLIIGTDLCVSVISKIDPTIRKVPRVSDNL